MSGCGAPTPDISSADGQNQILDEVNVALTSEQCTTAVNLILPLYDSQYSDNTVRLAAASSYGCDAGISFFALIDNLASNVSSLSGSAFWSLMAKLFPSTTGADYRMEGSFLATDALEAMTNTGALVLSSNQVNAGTYNVGSLLATDRTSDSNLYMIFVSMATIGSIESRYGVPDSSFDKTTSLPWTSASAMDQNGCGLASAVLNFIDGVTQTDDLLPSSISGKLSSLLNTGFTIAGVGTVGIEQLIGTACGYGCQGTTPDGNAAYKTVYDPNGNWVASGCNVASPCTSTCPTTLRNRAVCTGAATDENTCAAAGIINFINNSVGGWQ